MDRLVQQNVAFEPIGTIPPAEPEATYYAELNNAYRRAALKQNRLRETRRGSVKRRG